MQITPQRSPYRSGRRRLFGRKSHERKIGLFQYFGDFSVALASVGAQVAAVVKLDDHQRRKLLVGNDKIDYAEQFVAIGVVIKLIDKRDKRSLRQYLVPSAVKIPKQHIQVVLGRREYVRLFRIPRCGRFVRRYLFGSFSLSFLSIAPPIITSSAAASQRPALKKEVS